MELWPSLYISHGSPMHAIENTAAAASWRALAAELGKPRAILMVSAHWETNVPMLTSGAELPTIHDFGGFPEALYRIQYPAPGAPALAERVQTLLREADTCSGLDARRGLDHGAWVPLLHMYPDADVPVLQLSVQSDRGARHLLAVGRALQTLRSEGVLIIGSGSMTHNLRDFFTQRLPGNGNYAEEFRDWVDARLIAGRVDELLDWETQAPHALRAHPSPEHFLPLFAALGAAGEPYQARNTFRGFDGGVLAMDVYRFD
ncbi:class III extradiol ring-cleavage dioxygenase [Uliginosibacterium sediminicola]|uniref:Class III extradiol ring-cleavage dioxygenase n=1 Tax=Uliginosibacterium sediminicola TaxID=2024550 RepID=A0ABU9Z2N4_9RHOO